MPWIRKRFKENKVYVWCDDAGRPICDKRGLARFKYKEGDDKEYSGKAELIKELDFNPSAAVVETGEAKPTELPQPPAAPKDEIVIYTDGGARGNPGDAAYACVLICGNNLRDIAAYIGKATNNYAELLAVKKALEAVKRKDLHVTIYTDSTYVQGTIARGWKAKANKELIDEIKAAMRGFANITVCHVNGHDGVEGNERADALVNAALDARSGIDIRGKILEEK